MKTFLELSDEDRHSWRANPITAAFIEWVEWEKDRCAAAVNTLVYSGKVDQARAVSGATFALASVSAIIAARTPQPLPDPESDDFTDPARRPSLRRKDNAERK